MERTLDIERLRATVHGTVLSRADAGYDDARRAFNGAVDQSPGAIVQVASTTDISAAQQFAREQGVTWSVRGTGHGWTGAAMRGDIVIDLVALRGVTVDRGARRATVRAGSTWSELDAATCAHGLAVPGSRISRCSVAGHALRDGDGWLTGRHGRTFDNLISVDVVTRGGHQRTLSIGSDLDGIRAIPAGSVVTSLTIELHPIAPLVLGGLLLYRVEDAPDVLATLSQLRHESAPDFAPAGAFTTAPPARFVPGDIVGRPVFAVLPAWLSEASVGGRPVEALRSAAPPLADSVGPVTYPALQSSLDSFLPLGLRASLRSTCLRSANPAIAEGLVDIASDLPNRRSHIVLLPDAALSWTVHVVAQWINAEQDAEHESWSAVVLTRLEQACGALR